MELLGGLLGAAGSLFGSWMGSNTQEDIANKNIAMQMDMAKNGLSWRVQDAKNAGINPLAALGAQLSSFQNVVGGEGVGPGVAAAGQQIGRAVQAMKTPEERAEASAKTALDMESQGLDNDLKKVKLMSDLRMASQPGTPPALPALMTEYRDPRTGAKVWLPSTKASAGYMAMGIPGAAQATIQQVGSGAGEPPRPLGGHTGFEPWHLGDIWRWMSGSKH